MEQLKKKYADHDVEFLSMYVREPHAGERGFREYRDHESYDHKAEYAREVVELKGLTIPMLVDGMDQRFHKELGNLPNVAYVVGKDGIVTYHATWLMADEIDAALAELVTADDPANPVYPTIDTSGVGSEI